MADVLLLTQADCAFCDHAKAVLARLQEDFQLNVQEHDLASAVGRCLAVELGIVFAPGIVLDGELFSYGRPSERKLRKELQRRNAMTQAAREAPGDALQHRDAAE